MAQYTFTAPPKIVEVVTPTEFVDDLELVEKIVYEKMLRVYVLILFISILIIGFVVIF